MYNGTSEKTACIKTAGRMPEWMVTFSDCMTLLLTFFVLMLSFSSFDDISEVSKLETVFAEEFSIDSRTGNESDGVAASNLIQQQEGPAKGSEKATLAMGLGNQSKNEDISTNFRDRKVFLISSEEVFLGKGCVISPEGRKKLSNMALYLKEVPNRILISENLQDNAEKNMDFGLQRAWAVTDYLTTYHGLDKQRFSLSASGIFAQVNINETGDIKTKRRLEIVLLERSIYN